jgi:hypothetical protein
VLEKETLLCVLQALDREKKKKSEKKKRKERKGKRERETAK